MYVESTPEAMKVSPLVYIYMYVYTQKMVCGVYMHAGFSHKIILCVCVCAALHVVD